MNKNTIFSIILVVVILAGVFFVGRSLGFFGGGAVKVPDEVMNTPEERIDNVTLVVMTKTLGEWKKTGEQDGAYLNPETKTYTMVIPMECGACDEKIPALQFPARFNEKQPDEDSRIRLQAEKSQLMAGYMCPKCGKPAFTGFDAYGGRRPGSRVRKPQR